MNIPSYDQPEKQRARSLVLKRAVAAVTSDRHSSPLVRADEFQEALDFSLYFLQQHGFNGELAAEARAYAREWHTFSNCTLGQKSASEVRVLYLCGPEPRNDLDILLSLGVMPQNIWAIESEQRMYRQAVEHLAQSESFIRIHHGSLEEFFDTINERFDIIYIDACGPLPGGQPNTLRGPLLMFHRERLAPLGVLITNFSRPSNEKQEEFEHLISCFFHARSRDLPRGISADGADPAIAQYDPSYLWPYLRRHFAESYSDFITRFLVDLGREIVPLARIYDNPSLRRKYFAPDHTLKAALGHPYLVNPAASVRLSYVAKKTEMYLDALVFDQCRYYFDFLPTIDLMPRRLDSWAYQLVLRTCLDRIGRHDFSSSSHPFHGAALGGFGEFTSATGYDFDAREFNNGITFPAEIEE